MWISVYFLDITNFTYFFKLFLYHFLYLYLVECLRPLSHVGTDILISGTPAPRQVVLTMILRPVNPTASFRVTQGAPRGG